MVEISRLNTSQMPSDTEVPFYEHSLTNMVARAYETSTGIDVKWQVTDEGCVIVEGTLRGLDSQGYARFIDFITPAASNPLPLDFLRGEQSNEVVQMDPAILDDMMMGSSLTFDFSVTPEILHEALNAAVESGARLNRSISKLVKSFQHYIEKEHDQLGSGVHLVTVNTENQDVTHRANPKRVMLKAEQEEGRYSDIHWFDVDAQIPHGALTPRAIQALIATHVPKNVLNEEFQVFSLRGFSLDPNQPERVVRKKILVMVGERSLLTLHDGPVDKIGIHGKKDSISEFRELMLKRGNEHGDLFVNSRSSLKAIGPGAILLDLCTVLFGEQENVMKRYQDMLDHADYDATHSTPKKHAFTVDLGDAKDAIDYMSRRIEDSIGRIQRLCSARTDRVLARMFGTLEELAIEKAEHELIRRAENMTRFCESAKHKIAELEAHGVNKIANEHNHRQYLMTVAATLIIPQLAAVELAQVPSKIIAQNPELILMGGGVGSFIATLGFVLYDRFRKKKLGGF